MNKEIDMEKAFDNFLHGSKYDKAESELFSIVRAAFVAGWKSAGGDPPKADEILKIIKNK